MWVIYSPIQPWSSSIEECLSIEYIFHKNIFISYGSRYAIGWRFNATFAFGTNLLCCEI